MVKFLTMAIENFEMRKATPPTLRLSIQYALTNTLALQVWRCTFSTVPSLSMSYLGRLPALE